MKFVLTYDGELPSTGNGSKKTEKKWEIRKYFTPQFEDLWIEHPALSRLKGGRYINPAAGAFWMMETHHELQKELEAAPYAPQPNEVDLCAPIERFGYQFKPLVRKSFALVCGLKIIFLRREKVGHVYSGGDLDNRIKTLLDSLSMPQYQEQVVKNDASISAPILCLLEDDSLISGLSVESQRLLMPQNTPGSFVKLIIEVDVRVSDSRTYNAIFLGD